MKKRKSAKKICIVITSRASYARVKSLLQAIQNNKEISVCGDMAHQEQYLPFLLGIGVRILSTNPGYLIKMQKAISDIEIDQAKATAEKMLGQTKIRDLAQILNLNRSQD